MRKPNWIDTDKTFVESWEHPTAEASVEEHVNPDTDEKVYLVIDTSEPEAKAYETFREASNALGNEYGFSELWKEIRDETLRKSTINLPQYQWDHLEQAAIKLSSEQKRKISMADYLRMLVTKDIIDSSDPSK